MVFPRSVDLELKAFSFVVAIVGADIFVVGTEVDSAVRTGAVVGADILCCNDDIDDLLGVTGLFTVSPCCFVSALDPCFIFCIESVEWTLSLELEGAKSLALTEGGR